MKRSNLIFIFILIITSQLKAKDFAILLNGGFDKPNNKQRYLENIKSVYSAFKAKGLNPDDMIVIYGSGDVRDTTGTSYLPYLPTDTKITSQRGIGGGPIDISENAKKTALLTAPYLFSGDTKQIDGAAKKSVLKAKFTELKAKLTSGDNITLFITDHGELDANQKTIINLWGESLSVQELKKLLDDLPKTNQVHIITNICFGGGLAELTSENVCVAANQQPQVASYSQTTDLDLYSQNLAFGLKNKVDHDKDGKATLLDAHDYATNLDNPANTPMTSLDWFLEKNADKISSQKKQKQRPTSQKSCSNHPDSLIQLLGQIVNDFDLIKSKLNLSTEGIPESRKHLIKGRIEKAISLIKGSSTEKFIQDYELKIEDLKSQIESSAKNWDTLTPEQQADKRQQAQVEAFAMQSQLDFLFKERKRFAALENELDLLKYGDDDLFNEYLAIRKCLEYAF